MLTKKLARLTPSATQYRPQSWALVTVALAFTLRLLVRIWTGESDYLRNGYALYLSIARSVVDGHGLCFGLGVGCARRMPLYPLLIAPFLAVGHLFPWLPAIQAALGAAAVWFAWKIGLELAEGRTALVAAVGVALNPYAIVHDTAIQETALLNLFVAVAVHELLHLRRRESTISALGAGTALGLATLTSARVALFLPCALAWAARIRPRLMVLVALPVLVLVGGWAARNWVVVGSPVLSTELGKNLWVGNNEWTFSGFPERSIDSSQAESFRTLPLDRRAALASAHDDVERDRLEKSWAAEYAKAHPAEVAWGAVRKIWSAASAELTPATRSEAVRVIYRIIFFPVNVLAAIGLWRMRDRRTRALLLALIGSFAATTTIFWAHTSHKSYLDVVLIPCAALAIFGRPEPDATNPVA